MVRTKDDVSAGQRTSKKRTETSGRMKPLLSIRKGGRPLNSEMVYKPEFVALAQEYASKGYCDEEVAHKFGVNRKTLWSWRQKHKDLDEALQVGKYLDVMGILRTSTRQRAIGYNKTVVEERIDSKMGVVQLKREIHVPADPASLSIYCRNRIGKRWIERVIDDGVLDEPVTPVVVQCVAEDCSVATEKIEETHYE